MAAAELLLSILHPHHGYGPAGLDAVCMGQLHCCGSGGARQWWPFFVLPRLLKALLVAVFVSCIHPRAVSPKNLQDNTNGDVAAPVIVSCAVTSVSALRPVQWRAFDGQLVVWNR